MPYTPTTWVENVTTLGPTNMNHIEQGIANAPGTELAYAELTAGTVAISATTEATATTVVTAAAVTFDGTPVLVEFFAPRADRGTSAITFTLYDGASSIGILGNVFPGPTGVPVSLARRLTPSAASHTYSIRAYVDAGSGLIVGGTGGAAANMPAFIRITRV